MVYWEKRKLPRTQLHMKKGETTTKGKEVEEATKEKERENLLLLVFDNCYYHR